MSLIKTLLLLCVSLCSSASKWPSMPLGRPMRRLEGPERVQDAKPKVRVVRAASRELVFVLIASVQFGLQISWFEAFGTLSSTENRRVESFAPRGTDSAQKSQA